jgi:hypothetical protein
VGCLEGSGVQPAAEAAEHPQHGRGYECGDLHPQVGECEGQQPQRTPTAGQPQRGNHRYDEERGQQDDPDHERPDEEWTGDPADRARREHSGSRGRGGADTVQVAAGRGVSLLDPGGDAREVAIAPVPGPGRRRVT